MISLTMDAVPVIEGAHDRTTECAFFSIQSFRNGLQCPLGQKALITRMDRPSTNYKPSQVLCYQVTWTVRCEVQTMVWSLGVH